MQGPLIEADNVIGRRRADSIRAREISQREAGYMPAVSTFV
jgi:predicted RNase H-like nuclease